ncbi:unnamed protein product, partial [Discosporangium mesarthrocarpum]
VVPVLSLPISVISAPLLTRVAPRGPPPRPAAAAAAVDGGGTITKCKTIAGGRNHGQALMEEAGVHCCREVVLEKLGRRVLIAESPGQLGIGGKVWDAAFVLVDYLSAPDSNPHPQPQPLPALPAAEASGPGGWGRDEVRVRRQRRRGGLVKGKRVLELGSGTGLVALCCSLLGASEVVASDYQV